MFQHTPPVLYMGVCVCVYASLHWQVYILYFNTDTYLMHLNYTFKHIKALLS